MQNLEISHLTGILSTRIPGFTICSREHAHCAGAGMMTLGRCQHGRHSCAEHSWFHRLQPLKCPPCGCRDAHKPYEEECGKRPNAAGCTLFASSVRWCSSNHATPPNTPAVPMTAHVWVLPGINVHVHTPRRMDATRSI